MSRTVSLRRSAKLGEVGGVSGVLAVEAEVLEEQARMASAGRHCQSITVRIPVSQ